MQCTSGVSEKDNCLLAAADGLLLFFRMLLDELELTYE
jgi:hypothetical protein